MRRLTILCCCVWGLMGCESARMSEVSAAALTFTEHAPTYVEGAFRTAAGDVSFGADEHAEGAVSVWFVVQGKTLAFDIDYSRGHAMFTGATGILTEGDVAALHEVAVALDAALPTRPDDRSKAEHALVTQSAFLARAPANETLAPFEITADRSVVCLACACQWQHIGRGIWRWAGQGWDCNGGFGNGCKGHCGVGCHDNMQGNYTQDCALHDYEIAWWWEASDDYAFGGCWCNGW